MWTEVCGRKLWRKLWMEVVDRRRKLWTVDGNDFRSSLLGRDRPYGAQNDK